MVNGRMKVVVVGDVGVGKTSLLQQYKNKRFNQNYTTTINIDFFEKDIKVKDSELRLQIWDFTGQEEQKETLKSYYRDAEVFYVVYDVTNEQSFLNVKEWVRSIRDKMENPYIIVIANKTDLLAGQKVSLAQVKALVEKLNLQGFYSVSAKTAENIETAFEEPVAAALVKRPDVPSRYNNEKTPMLSQKPAPNYDTEQFLDIFNSVKKGKWRSYWSEQNKAKTVADIAKHAVGENARFKCTFFGKQLRFGGTEGHATREYLKKNDINVTKQMKAEEVTEAIYHKFGWSKV